MCLYIKYKTNPSYTRALIPLPKYTQDFSYLYVKNWFFILILMATNYTYKYIYSKYKRTEKKKNNQMHTAGTREKEQKKKHIR